ncbi:MAG: EI24 domain-containing protein [Spirochaetia bacterium]|nr:EI24 domain-containing protein [Spirochaetia bacterium]
MKTAEDTYLSRLKNGMNSFLRAFKFIGKNNLWKYIIFPSLLSSIIGILMTYLIYNTASENILNLIKNINIAENYEGWLKVLLSILFSILSIFSYLISIILGMTITIIFYRAAASMIVMPFLAPLISRVETILTGKSIEVSIIKEIKNSFAGFWISLKNFLIEILILILSGPISPIVMIFVEGYFLGKGSFDYFFEKHSESIKERKEKSKLYRPEIQGLGIAHFFCLFIPLFGVFVAPPVSVVAAALVFYKE